MRGVPDFAVFVGVGGFASLVNLVARILFDRVTSYEAAIVLAFPVGLTTAFLLNRLLVFKPVGSAWHGQYLRFLIVNLVALGQVFLVSLLFARVIFPRVGMTWQADTVAHGIGLLSPLLTSYHLHKRFSFAAPRTQP